MGRRVAVTKFPLHGYTVFQQQASKEAHAPSLNLKTQNSKAVNPKPS